MLDELQGLLDRLDANGYHVVVSITHPEKNGLTYVKAADASMIWLIKEVMDRYCRKRFYSENKT